MCTGSCGPTGLHLGVVTCEAPLLRLGGSVGWRAHSCCAPDAFWHFRPLATVQNTPDCAKRGLLAQGSGSRTCKIKVSAGLVLGRPLSAFSLCPMQVSLSMSSSSSCEDASPTGFQLPTDSPAPAHFKLITPFKCPVSRCHHILWSWGDSSLQIWGTPLSPEQGGGHHCRKDGQVR